MLHDSYGGRGILTFGLAPVSHPDSVSRFSRSLSSFKVFRVFWLSSFCSLLFVRTDSGEGAVPPVKLHFRHRPHGQSQLFLLPADPAWWTGQAALLSVSVHPPLLRCEACHPVIVSGLRELQSDPSLSDPPL